jgi:hypothetical protein
MLILPLLSISRIKEEEITYPEIAKNTSTPTKPLLKKNPE